MLKGIVTIAAAVAATWASAAAAAPVIFSGGGVVARSTGALPATGTAGVGDPFRFSFTFDPDDATLVRGADAQATYALPVTDFTAELGRYSFTPATGTAALNIGRGFAFFGQPFSEPSRVFSFSFSGTAGAGAPFDFGAGMRLESFSVTANYRDPDPTRPVSLADVVDPAGTPNNSISYFASTGVPRGPTGSLTGIFVGGFQPAVSGVPEPATWGLMILGFGAVGGALRRRGRAWAPANA